MRFVFFLLVAGCGTSEDHGPGNPWPKASQECEPLPRNNTNTTCLLYLCCEGFDCWQQTNDGKWARPCSGAECDFPLPSGAEICNYTSLL